MDGLETLRLEQAISVCHGKIDILCISFIIWCAFISLICSFIVHLIDRWAGQALFGTLTPDVVVLTLLYSIAGVLFLQTFMMFILLSSLTFWFHIMYLQLGIAIVNDFKSVEGDRAMGLQSLPVAFGTEAAKWICVSAIDVTQLSVAGMWSFVQYLNL